MLSTSLDAELHKQFTSVTKTEIDGEYFYLVCKEDCAISESKQSVAVELSVVDSNDDEFADQPTMLVALTIGDEAVFLTQNAAGRIADAIAKTKAVITNTKRNG